jgi:ribose-phosphate pyrophosphokinase
MCGKSYLRRTFFVMLPTAKIFSGTGSQHLTEQICKRYGITPGKINIQRFSDGEIQPIFLESIRGDVVFLVQSTCAPSDNLMELLLMIDAARRASAHRIVAVSCSSLLWICSPGS